MKERNTCNLCYKPQFSLLNAFINHNKTFLIQHGVHIFSTVDFGVNYICESSFSYLTTVLRTDHVLWIVPGTGYTTENGVDTALFSGRHCLMGKTHHKLVNK